MQARTGGAHEAAESKRMTKAHARIAELMDVYELRHMDNGKRRMSRVLYKLWTEFGQTYEDDWIPDEVLHQIVKEQDQGLHDENDVVDEDTSEWWKEAEAEVDAILRMHKTMQTKAKGSTSSGMSKFELELWCELAAMFRWELIPDEILGQIERKGGQPAAEARRAIDRRASDLLISRRSKLRPVLRTGAIGSSGAGLSQQSRTVQKWRTSRKVYSLQDLHQAAKRKTKELRDYSSVDERHTLSKETDDRTNKRPKISSGDVRDHRRRTRPASPSIERPRSDGYDDPPTAKRGDSLRQIFSSLLPHHRQNSPAKDEVEDNETLDQENTPTHRPRPQSQASVPVMHSASAHRLQGDLPLVGRNKTRDGPTPGTRQSRLAAHRPAIIGDDTQTADEEFQRPDSSRDSRFGSDESLNLGFDDVGNYSGPDVSDSVEPVHRGEAEEVFTNDEDDDGNPELHDTASVLKPPRRRTATKATARERITNDATNAGVEALQETKPPAVPMPPSRPSLHRTKARTAISEASYRPTEHGDPREDIDDDARPSSHLRSRPQDENAARTKYTQEDGSDLVTTRSSRSVGLAKAKATAWKPRPKQPNKPYLTASRHQASEEEQSEASHQAQTRDQCDDADPLSSQARPLVPSSRKISQQKQRMVLERGLMPTQQNTTRIPLAHTVPDAQDIDDSQLLESGGYRASQLRDRSTATVTSSTQQNAGTIRPAKLVRVNPQLHLPLFLGDDEVDIYDDKHRYVGTTSYQETIHTHSAAAKPVRQDDETLHGNAVTRLPNALKHTRSARHNNEINTSLAHVSKARSRTANQRGRKTRKGARHKQPFSRCAFGHAIKAGKPCKACVGRERKHHKRNTQPVAEWEDEDEALANVEGFCLSGHTVDADEPCIECAEDELKKRKRVYRQLKATARGARRTAAPTGGIQPTPRTAPSSRSRTGKTLTGRGTYLQREAQWLTETGMKV